MEAALGREGATSLGSIYAAPAAMITSAKKAPLGPHLPSRPFFAAAMRWLCSITSPSGWGAFNPCILQPIPPSWGLMEKRKPHYTLADIKAAFADPATLNRSFVSKQGADALKVDDAAVVAIMQALTAADFEKSMTSYADHRVWQDVYKPKAAGTELYVKVTLDAQQALFLISFKEA